MTASHTTGPTPGRRPGLADRWRGSLLGTGLGDAVGAPVEGASAVDEAEVRRWMSSSRPLRWTDDTAMALGLARALVEADGEVDPQRLGDTFAADHRAEPWRGYGAGPPQVFIRAARGTPYLEAAAALYDGGSYGNGAAMRAAPCAIAGGDDLDRVADLARRQSVVTHAHPLAQDGAVLLAVGVAATAHLADSDDPGVAIDRTLPHLRTDELRAAAGLARERGPDLAPRQIARELGRAWQPSRPSPRPWPPSSVPPTTPRTSWSGPSASAATRTRSRP